MSLIKESENKLTWSNTVELIDNLRVDEVGLKERVASLSTPVSYTHLTLPTILLV